MAKDTFYFSHDYNSRADEKIKLLIRKHGILGYGIFWAIVEDLYNNANALRMDSDGIAFDLRVDKNIVESILNDFDLFVMKDDFFGSLSVERRLNDRNLKSLKARESANSRWSKAKEDANALRAQCDGNAIKERKGKEIKEIKEVNLLDLQCVEKIKTWRDEFNIYIKDLNSSLKILLSDKDWFAEREKFHPNLDIKKTLEKSYLDYWSLDAGWKNKIKSKTKAIDWKATFNNALTQKMNQVYKTKEYGKDTNDHVY